MTWLQGLTGQGFRNTGVAGTRYQEKSVLVRRILRVSSENNWLADQRYVANMMKTRQWGN